MRPVAFSGTKALEPQIHASELQLRVTGARLTGRGFRRLACRLFRPKREPEGRYLLGARVKRERETAVYRSTWSKHTWLGPVHRALSPSRPRLRLYTGGWILSGRAALCSRGRAAPPVTVPPRFSPPLSVLERTPPAFPFPLRPFFRFLCHHLLRFKPEGALDESCGETLAREDPEAHPAIRY